MVELVDEESWEHDPPDERPVVSHPLNLVLYGPPGTGKTYSVQGRALKVLGVDPESLSSEQIGDRFRSFLQEGRVEFVTFHPSYSYEEFIEGYRYDEDAKVPKLHKGIFRRVVEQALSPVESVAAEGARIWKVSLGGAKGGDVFDRCVAENEIAIGWLEDTNLNGLGREDIAAVYESKYGTTQAANSINSINYLVNEMSNGDYVVVLKDRRHIRAIGVINGDYRYKGAEHQQHRPHTRPVLWLDTVGVHEITRMNEGKVLVQQTVYPLDRIPLQRFVRLLPEAKQEGKPHVLVIDEINRGNVSRIFGELITLLEGDKRLGAPNELSIRLPYSNLPFAVPPNLYLIGTMNTADRSIALIDSALRRRFDFEEMMPNVGVVRSVLRDKRATPDGQDDEHVDLVCDFFEVLNRRIAVLFDRDHQVGHSYLLDATDVEGLHFALYSSVFPLLQKYFYNDFERLQRLLGKYDASTPKGFVRRREDFSGAFGDDEVLEEELPWEFFVYPEQQLVAALRNTFLPVHG
jgi:5-methylcytosine-specific restriction protein B